MQKYILKVLSENEIISQNKNHFAIQSKYQSDRKFSNTGPLSDFFRVFDVKLQKNDTHYIGILYTV